MNYLLSRDYWMDQFYRLTKNREIFWKKISDPNFKEEWFSTRIHKDLWSIDEILRHMLASEKQYIHSKFDSTVSFGDWAVGAQWVGDRNFGLKEKPHMVLIDVKNLATEFEITTEEFLEISSEKKFKEKVKAPWGDELPFYELLTRYFEHEDYHRGQINLLLTYFKLNKDTT